MFLIATLSRDTPTDGSMVVTGKSILYSSDIRTRVRFWYYNDGNYWEFKWNDVVWYIQLEDLQLTLHSLPVPSSSAH